MNAAVLSTKYNRLHIMFAKVWKWTKVSGIVLGVLAFFWLLQAVPQAERAKNVRIRNNWTHLVQMLSALETNAEGAVLVFRSPGYYGKLGVVVSVGYRAILVMPGPGKRTVVNEPVKLYAHEKADDLLEVERIVKKDEPDWPKLMREFYSR